MSVKHEEMPLDVLFVGAGPANLAGAIHLMQLAKAEEIDIEVGVIDKGETIGTHSLSGAILDPIALKELVPSYLETDCPIEQMECQDSIHFLMSDKSLKIPFTPNYMHNEGCHIVSLSKFVRWLGDIAEDLGVMIFPGFTGKEIIYGETGSQIIGVRTGDKGTDKSGKQKPNFEPGVDILAKVTVFGEGSKGSLLHEIDKKIDLFNSKPPQTFETAIKEVIELPKDSPFLKESTTVIHSFGYPLGLNTKGGGFLYKMSDNCISLGLVVGLDYEDPMLDPYDAFLQLKQHPLISNIIKEGKVLQQGAKTLCAGGYYSMPKLAINGAMFVGDSASMLNSQRLKGIHTGMKSGMLAAQTIIHALGMDDFSSKILEGYTKRYQESWIHDELFKSRNFSQALGKRFPFNYFHLGAQYITGGRGIQDPINPEPDDTTMKPLSRIPQDKKSKVDQLDGVLYVDKLTGVYLSGTIHEEDQPCHLVVHDHTLCVGICYEQFRNPCTRFCPGAVYEMEIKGSDSRSLKLNPSNCLHCKTCEIKDPFQNITWNCPEEGGPKYTIV